MMGEEAEACPITKGPSLRVTPTGCPTVFNVWYSLAFGLCLRWDFCCLCFGRCWFHRQPGAWLSWWSTRRAGCFLFLGSAPLARLSVYSLRVRVMNRCAGLQKPDLCGFLMKAKPFSPTWMLL